ncbi:STAS domain-containing protein [Nocardia aurantiaca]|nr:STAS domain-containing protein [Nocardia aurantiaca]
MSTVSLVRSHIAHEVAARRSRFTRDTNGRSTAGTGSIDCLVIAVTGELDINGLPAFRTTLSTAVDAGPPAVVVDLRYARFLSLGNAVVLLDAVQRAARRGVGVFVPTAPRPIERVLDLTGVRALVDREPDVLSS